MNSMKRFLFFILVSLVCTLHAANDESLPALDSTWMAFRNNHPYGFQTVGLRHSAEGSIFVISEPSESVSKEAVAKLFQQYGGKTVIKQKQFGYDGWLSDIVGQVRFQSANQEKAFTHDLFTLLYGTDYKAYYTDLDNPQRHVYYSPYELNYSISAAELMTWFIDDNEMLRDASGVTKNISSWLASSFQESNKLLFSVERGFVVWLINTKKVSSGDKLFKTNARKFSLDSDLIIGAFGKKCGNVAVIAREREVPVDVLPPLRIETLTLLATTSNKSLAQSYERYNVFAGKLKGNKDFAPIYLSDELWHTEYGNLLNVADQMLKSWSQNGKIDYYDFDYPKPIDWAFRNGAIEDMGSEQLTYNWNTKGAGYIIEDDYDVYAINRTGSLPVSYFPDGKEGQMEDKVYDAEELAYDFFSQLNNPELVRVVQYAAFYQILTYFRDGAGSNSSRTSDSSLPDYRVFDSYVENILRFVDTVSDISNTTLYQSGLKRFKERVVEAEDVTQLLTEYMNNDPYGEFGSYLAKCLDLGSLLEIMLGPTESSMEETFRYYVDTNITILKQYMDEYKNEYKTFPYAEAAKYIVSPRELQYQAELIGDKINKLNEDYHKVYDDLYDKYYRNLEKLDKESSELEKNVCPWAQPISLKEDRFSDLVLPELELLEHEIMWLELQLQSKRRQTLNVREGDTVALNALKEVSELENKLANAKERKKALEKSSTRKKAPVKKEKEEEDLYDKVFKRLQRISNNALYIHWPAVNALIDKWNANVEIGERMTKMQNAFIVKLQPYVDQRDRLYSLQVGDKQQKAIGALNWLLTDPTPYAEPSGAFFADKLPQHKRWTKSPSMTCSFNGTGYGGHNLDAHVTPVKSSADVPQGKCRVTFQDGNRVISVAKADRKRITPEVLRQVERRVATDNTLVNLPPTPPTRPKTTLLASGTPQTGRGYNAASLGIPTSTPRTARVGTTEVKTVDEFVSARAAQSSSSGEVRMKRYSEREYLVESDGQQYVLERSESNTVDLNDMSPTLQEELRGNSAAVIMTPKAGATSNQGYRTAKVEIICPREVVPEVKASINNMMGNPSIDANNSFKILRNLRMDIRESNPNFNAKDIQLEEVLFSHIIILEINKERDGQQFHYGNAA